VLLEGRNALQNQLEIFRIYVAIDILKLVSQLILARNGTMLNGF
jgi:hypothetical protein